MPTHLYAGLSVWHRKRAYFVVLNKYRDFTCALEQLFRSLEALGGPQGRSPRGCCISFLRTYMRRSFSALLLLLALCWPPAVFAATGTPFPDGAVVQLVGTDHLWIAFGGTLH